MTSNISNEPLEADPSTAVNEPRLWCHKGWSARIIKNEDDPHALLKACDAYGEALAGLRVAAGFRLTMASASAWIDDDFRKPR